MQLTSLVAYSAHIKSIISNFSCLHQMTCKWICSNGSGINPGEQIDFHNVIRSSYLASKHKCIHSDHPHLWSCLQYSCDLWFWLKRKGNQFSSATNFTKQGMSWQEAYHWPGDSMRRAHCNCPDHVVSHLLMRWDKSLRTTLLCHGYDMGEKGWVVGLKWLDGFKKGRWMVIGEGCHHCSHQFSGWWWE
jgi:hypothetical protein